MACKNIAAKISALALIMLGSFSFSVAEEQNEALHFAVLAVSKGEQNPPQTLAIARAWFDNDKSADEQVLAKLDEKEKDLLKSSGLSLEEAKTMLVDDQSFLIRFAFQHKDADLAAKIANLYAAKLVDFCWKQYADTRVDQLNSITQMLPLSQKNYAGLEKRILNLDENAKRDKILVEDLADAKELELKTIAELENTMDLLRFEINTATPPIIQIIPASPLKGGTLNAAKELNSAVLTTDANEMHVIQALAIAKEWLESPSYDKSIRSRLCKKELELLESSKIPADKAKAVWFDASGFIMEMCYLHEDANMSARMTNLYADELLAHFIYLRATEGLPQADSLAQWLKALKDLPLFPSADRLGLKEPNEGDPRDTDIYFKLRTEFRDKLALNGKTLRENILIGLKKDPPPLSFVMRPEHVPCPHCLERCRVR